MKKGRVMRRILYRVAGDGWLGFVTGRFLAGRRFFERVERLQFEQGLSRAAVCKQVGLSVTLLNWIRRGQAPVSERMIYKLGRAERAADERAYAAWKARGWGAVPVGGGLEGTEGTEKENHEPAN